MQAIITACDASQPITSTTSSEPSVEVATQITVTSAVEPKVTPSLIPTLPSTIAVIPSSTPAQIITATPTTEVVQSIPTPIVEYPKFIVAGYDYRVVSSILRIRKGYSTDDVVAPIDHTVYYGTVLHILCLIYVSASEVWGSEQPCDYIGLKLYSAIQIGATEYMKAVEGPQGYIFNNDTVELLARNCVAEVRGMKEKREDACLSVTSTVLTRTTTRHISTGTVESTLNWHSGHTWQFVPWVTLGCEYVDPIACLDNYSLDWARHAIGNYIIGERGSCDDYLYYNSIEGGNNDCIILSSNGSYIEFHSKDKRNYIQGE